MGLIKSLFQNRSNTQIAVKNATWLFVSNSVLRVFKFFLIVVAARVLGPERYGIFSYGLSLGLLLYMFSELGLGAIYTKEYYQAGVDRVRLMVTGLQLKVILLVLAVLISLIYFYTSQDVLHLGMFVFLSAYYAVDSLRKYLVSVVRTVHQMESEAISDMCGSLVTTGAGIWLLFQSPSLFALAWAYFAGATVSVLVLLFVLRGKLRLSMSVDAPYMRRMSSLMLPFAAAVMIYSVLTSMDSVMIRWMMGTTEVGYYSTGSKWVQFLIMIPIIFSSIGFSFFSQYADDRARLLSILKRLLNALMLIVFPVMLGSILLAKEIILLVFGPDYLPGLDAFRMLMLMLPFSFLSLVILRALLAVDRHHDSFRISFLSVMLNLSANSILIMKMGIVGAALATTLSRVLDLYLSSRVLVHELGEAVFETKSVLRYIGASGLMMGGIYMFQELGVTGLFPLIFIAGTLYLATLIVCGDPVLTELSSFVSRGLRRQSSL